jgi:hypothetical protein
MKIININGEPCISTKELCNWLGVQASVERIVEMVNLFHPDPKAQLILVPFVNSKTGTYWLYEDLSLIARSVAMYMHLKATTMDYRMRNFRMGIGL